MMREIIQKRIPYQHYNRTILIMSELFRGMNIKWDLAFTIVLYFV